LFKSVSTIYPQISIFLDRRTVKRIPHVNFSKVYLDEKLHWTSNIISMSNKISKKYRIISTLKYKLPSTIFFMLQNTMILPYISCCNIAWGVVVKSFRIFSKTTKKTIRIVCKTGYRRSYQSSIEISKNTKITCYYYSSDCSIYV